MLVTELEVARKSLETTNKENTILSLRLEEATKAAEDDRTKAATALTEAQNEVNLLKRSVDTFKLDLQKASSQNEELIKERDSAIVDWDKLAAENSVLGDEVCEKRQRGFEQGITQCHYFFNTALEHDGFDIMKVYLDGQLVDLSAQVPTGDEMAPANATKTIPSAILIVSEEIVPIPSTNKALLLRSMFSLYTFMLYAF